MILKILSAREKSLKLPSKPISKIDKKILKLVSDMKDTLIAQKDPKGVGLAAPQVGKNIRLILITDKGKIIPMINPQIIWSSGQESKTQKKENIIMEGCLSLPNYYGNVRRKSKVKVRFINPEGKIIEQKFEGFSAQIVQHEIDHLNGKIFIERLLEQNGSLFKLNNNEWEEVKLT